MENRRARRRSEQHMRDDRIAVERRRLARDPDAKIRVELTEAERSFIATALAEWGGVANPTEELAVLMGFAGSEELYEQSGRLIPAIMAGEPLTARDWKRVLLSTEISFGSDYFGVGWEWETVSDGQDDQAGVLTLREIQDKLIWIAHLATPPDDPPAS
jgi:hypothetical protein